MVASQMRARLVDVISFDQGALFRSLLGDHYQLELLGVSKAFRDEFVEQARRGPLTDSALILIRRSLSLNFLYAGVGLFGLHEVPTLQWLSRCEARQERAPQEPARVSLELLRDHFSDMKELAGL